MAGLGWGRWRLSLHRLSGRLIAIEGIDQAGKRTVGERLAQELRANHIAVEFTGFPDYTTALGKEIGRFLADERRYPPQVRQLLYAANRWERADELRTWLSEGRVVLVDRYVASGIAYGVAQGLERDWMWCLEDGLPPPDLTILLDIPPDVSVRRKTAGRDAYESSIDLMAEARRVYRELSDAPSWRVIDGCPDRESVWQAVLAAVRAFAEEGCTSSEQDPTGAFSWCRS
jgi:dTMP kinase